MSKNIFIENKSDKTINRIDCKELKICFSEEDFDDLLDKVKQEYHNMEARLADFVNEMTEWNKDEEIQLARYEAKTARENALVILSPIEKQRIEEFRRKHYKTCAQPHKMSGSTYIYTITGTGIGEIVEIQCPVCGEKVDITDLESW